MSYMLDTSTYSDKGNICKNEILCLARYHSLIHVTQTCLSQVKREKQE